MNIIMAAIAAVLSFGIMCPASANEGPQDLTVSYSSTTPETDVTKFKVTMSDPESGRIATALDWRVVRQDGTTARKGTESFTWSSDYSQEFNLRVEGNKTVHFKVYYYYVNEFYLIDESVFTT